MNARAAFSRWESGDDDARKLTLENPPEARKHQRSRSRSHAVAHKPIWARNEREEGRFRYNFRHHDDTQLYMEQYRKENAFSTIAACRTEGDMQTEKSRLYNALGNGYLSHQVRAAYESYKTVLEAAHMRKVMESRDQMQCEIQHDTVPNTITLQLPLPPIPIGRSLSKNGRKASDSTSSKEERRSRSPSFCQHYMSDTFTRNNSRMDGIQAQLASDECRCPAGVSKLYMEVMHDCTTREVEQANWKVRKLLEKDTENEKGKNGGLTFSEDRDDDCNYKQYTPEYLFESKTEQLQWHAIVGALPSVVSWLQKLNTARRTQLLDPLPHEVTGISLHKRSASAYTKSVTTTTTTTTDALRPNQASSTVEKSESQPNLVAPSETELETKLRSRTEAIASFVLDPLFHHQEHQVHARPVRLRKNPTHPKRPKPFANHAGVTTVQQSKWSAPPYMASFSKSILMKPQSKATSEE